jgi:hypothetical protein
MLHVMVVMVGIVILVVGTFIVGGFIIWIFQITIPRTIITKVIISGNTIQVILWIITGGFVGVVFFAGSWCWVWRNVSSECNAWSCSGISGVSGGATSCTGGSGLGGLGRYVSDLRKVESMSSNIPYTLHILIMPSSIRLRSIGVADLM